MKKYLLTAAVLVMSSSGAFAAAPDGVAKLASDCCALVGAACCALGLPCC